MRKYKRYAMRRYAERKGIKASRYVRDAWEHYQIKRVGRAVRAFNWWRSTRPKRNWRAA